MLSKLCDWKNRAVDVIARRETLQDRDLNVFLLLESSDPSASVKAYRLNCMECVNRGGWYSGLSRLEDISSETGMFSVVSGHEFRTAVWRSLVDVTVEGNLCCN